MLERLRKAWITFGILLLFAVFIILGYLLFVKCIKST